MEMITAREPLQYACASAKIYARPHPDGLLERSSRKSGESRMAHSRSRRAGRADYFGAGTVSLAVFLPGRKRRVIRFGGAGYWADQRELLAPGERTERGDCGFHL